MNPPKAARSEAYPIFSRHDKQDSTDAHAVMIVIVNPRPFFSSCFSDWIRDILRGKIRASLLWSQFMHFADLLDVIDYFGITIIVQGLLELYHERSKFR